MRSIHLTRSTIALRGAWVQINVPWFPRVTLTEGHLIWFVPVLKSHYQPASLLLTRRDDVAAVGLTWLRRSYQSVRSPATAMDFLLFWKKST